MNTVSLLEGPFDQDKLQHVRHQLSQHPLMSRESLGALAMRHPPEFVRFHDGVRGMATKLGDVLGVDPKRDRLRKCIESLESAKTFVQIINVPNDPMYRPLIAEFHAEVAELFPRGQRDFVNRDAAAFLASPRSVTPYHLDHEQNFLLHVAGPKRLYTWRHDDRALVSEQALEVFYGEGSSRDVHCPDDAKAKARVHDLQPGDGVYMPMGSPHAVETGDGVTITFSMLMNTRTSMERVGSYEANLKLRKFGMSPTPVGSAARDYLKRGALQMYRRSKELVRPRRKRASTSPWYQS
jgi:hypothetical protein